MPKLAELLTYLLELIDRLKHRGLYTRKDERFLEIIRERLIWADGVVGGIQKLIRKITGNEADAS